jgi:hypothetical protein
MACDVDFSFLTDDCRPDNGALRTALEELTDIACNPIVPVDPNEGDCGEWGPFSTIESITFNETTKELTISAQPYWSTFLLNSIASLTFSTPVNITPIGLYAGVDLNILFTNPSDCRSCILVGNYYQINNTIETRAGTYVHQLRDITSGAPGVVLGDMIRLIANTGAVTSQRADDVLNLVPFAVVLPPSGSLNQTVRTNIETTTVASSPSSWIQTQIQILAIGGLV